jgi:phage shock protein PspC (stress-responsive transcriptional regulator)
MTKTISINLGGLLFHIDDLAYQQLLAYLDAIERQFMNETERTEIMRDIETRIAELFSERINRSTDVISTTDVAAAMAVMGQPDDFAPIQDETEEQQRKNFRRPIHTKRMYRDPDERMMGGVCAGLGAYFNTDPWIFRILFIVFAVFFLTGILVYVILWIALPEAVTTAQKLEMHGEPVTIDNIINAVKDEFNEVKDRMRWR